VVPRLDDIVVLVLTGTWKGWINIVTGGNLRKEGNNAMFCLGVNV
jgi:hypothetical protein